MSTLTILYWRDIPAQIIARAGRSAAKRELPLRFTEAIDRAAMLSGEVGTEAYLAAWRKGEPMPCGADLEAEAEATMARIVAAYDSARLARLAQNGGSEPAHG